MNFYSTLQKIQTGHISQTELNRFIEKLFQIAHKFVKYNSGRIKRIIIEYGSNILEDIAVDSIIPLVSQNRVDGKYFITTKFESWQPAVISEEDAEYFLFKIISLSVNQQISALLREFDPFFSKLLDSVNYFIKSQSYNKINVAGKIFITEPDFNLSHSHFIDREYLFNSPSELFLNKKELLPSLFEYYKEIFDGSIAIPLYDLIYKLKELNTSSDFAQSFSNPAESFEIKEITKKGLESVLVRIEDSYLNKGKLDEKEFFQISEALKLIGNDLMDGGINPGLNYYLFETMPGLTKEAYQTKYHNIFEYMVKIYRQKLVELLN